MSARLVSAGVRTHYWHHPAQDAASETYISSDALNAMNQDDKLIDLNAERAKRVHDLNDKRLNEVRQAFEQAMPLGKAKKKPKNKPKKR
ncbi:MULTISPECIES: hypothetical protein [unclassified Pseudomonas]|uniref:hypothetical protein n=2 Tax=Pseudomonas TaxID=286 RepID=UPI0012E2FF1A|nr:MULTISPECIES: hypothetical protein [unclassified Pseudomonas]WPN50015.1 hypothetical protein QMK58_23125 [Pseudomonas sp. P8_241]